MDILEIKDFWDILTAISSFILASGVIAAFFTYLKSKNDAKLSQFNTFIENLGSESGGREAREHVLKEFAFSAEDSMNKEALDMLSKESRYKVELVLSRFNRISFLALKNVLSKKEVVELMGHSMLRCWNNTKYFIKARRKQQTEPEEGSWGCYMYPLQLFLAKQTKLLKKISPEEHFFPTEDKV